MLGLTKQLKKINLHRISLAKPIFPRNKRPMGLTNKKIFINNYKTVSDL